MILYKIRFKLLSPLITPLKGDTIWGHIVWGIANNEGEKAVEEFLQEEKKSPHLIVSSAFPSDFICKPYPVPNERTKELNLEEYARIKQTKKVKYVKASNYLESADSDTDDCKDTEKEKHSFVSEIRMHNSIDRYSNTVMEGNLFTETELWPKTQYFDIYVLSSFTAERVYQLCTWAFENGYGADASVGKGRIKIMGKPEEVRIKNKGSVYLALGPFVLDDSDRITDLRADVFLRTGKLGGGNLISENPHKKSVLLYDEGAVFTSSESISYIGHLLKDVHSDKRICQAAFAPVIPIN